MTTAIAAARQDTDMSLNVPPEFERAIRERVESGAYASEADVFAACLEALEQGGSEPPAKLEALRHDIEFGREQAQKGQCSPLDEAYHGLRVRLEQPNRSRELNVPVEFERAVRDRVERGANDSFEDLFRECLDALPRWEAEQTAKLDALRAAIRVGVENLERGQVVDGHEAFARARARLVEKARARDELHPR